MCGWEDRLDIKMAVREYHNTLNKNNIGIIDGLFANTVMGFQKGRSVGPLD